MSWFTILLRVLQQIVGARLLIYGLIFICTWTDAAQDDDICDLPTPEDPTKMMPEFAKAYEVGMLVSNSKSKESKELLLGTDGRKAYVQVTLATGQFTYIGDYQREQLIKIDRIPRASNNLICTVSNLLEADNNGEWMFGHNATSGPHPNDPGWVFLMKEFNAIYTGNEVVMGIPCNTWEACKEIPLSDNTLEKVRAKFYWSDPDLWTPVIGFQLNSKPYSVPVSTEITRKVKDEITTELYNIFRYSIPGPQDEAYRIPDGLFCSGLKGESNELPTIPDYYSYQSEIILHEEFVDQILYQKHYFDNKLKLTRLEFSPDVNDKPSESDQPNPVGKVTLIQDLNSGLSYLIDSKFETCEVNRIDQIAENSDITSKTNLRTENVLAYLNNKNITYSYHQQNTERGIPSAVFMGKHIHTEATYEFQFSSVFEEIEGENMWTRNKPIKFSVRNKHAAPNEFKSVDINIFNFDVAEPSMLDYDISPCIPAELHRHLQFQLNGRYDTMPAEVVSEFKYQIMITLLQTMKVGPLRINNVEVETHNDVTNVYFTLLPNQTTPSSTINGSVEVTSFEAVERLRTSIDETTFIIGEADGPVKPMLSIPHSLMVLDDFPCNPNIKSTSEVKSMPSLAKSFTAGVLINVARDKTSYELTLGTTGNKAFVKLVKGGVIRTLVGDYNRGQLITTTQLETDSRPTSCVAKSLERATEDGEWIFGYNWTGTAGRPHQNDPRWVFPFIGYNEQYMGQEIAAGIPCNRWDACSEIPFADGTKELVGVKFYWSDPESWTPATVNSSSATPYSIPVKIEVSRQVEDKNVKEVYNFFRYSTTPPSQEMFDFPQGVYCRGLDTVNVNIPKVPDYYSYESETIIKKGFRSYVYYQKHYIDDILKLSRMEFSSLLDDLLLPTGNPTNSSIGEYVQIQDFNAGLSYLILTDSDICAISKISQEDEDMQLISNIKMRLDNPMEFLKLPDVNYTYYESKKLRDIPATMFKGFKPGTRTGDPDMVYEYWVSAPLAQLEGKEKWSSRAPLKFSIYPVLDPGNSTNINIFRFDVAEPDILHYDISACTPADQRQYLTFDIPVLYDDLMIPSIVQFKHDILLALVQCMKISALRIHNIELDENNNVTTIIFTLLMKQTAERIPAYKEDDELSSDDAIKLFESRVNNGSFILEVPGVDIGPLVAVKESVQRLSERPTSISPGCSTPQPGLYTTLSSESASSSDKSTSVTGQSTPSSNNSPSATDQSTPSSNNSPSATDQSTPSSNNSPSVTGQSTPIFDHSSPTSNQSPSISDYSPETSQDFTPPVCQCTPAPDKNTSPLDQSTLPFAASLPPGQSTSQHDQSVPPDKNTSPLDQSTLPFAASLPPDQSTSHPDQSVPPDKNTSPLCQSTPSTSPSADQLVKACSPSGYNGGDMAGLAVGMLVLGGLIGALIMYVIRPKPFVWPLSFDNPSFNNDDDIPVLRP